MPAEKKDGHSEADNANAGSARIFARQHCFPDRSGPNQLSALCRGQNLAGPLRVYSLEHTSEPAIRPACCSSSPIQRPASDNRASPGGQGVVALPAMSDGYKAAGPGEIEPALRSPAEYCLT